MFSLLTTPWALWGLLAVPALLAIYWLRNRFRQVPVSSLMLWREQKEARQGGFRIRRLQTPLLFFLELLALVLMVGAAAGPSVSMPSAHRPLVVVLDNSFSMQAGGNESARVLAEKALLEELDRGIRYSVRFVLAGETAQLVGEPARTTSEARAILTGWHCQSAAARLPEAMALARALGGDDANILILSDQPPAFDLDKGQVQWWAFGKARPNIAFVNASRTMRDNQDRCLFEIANLAPQAQDSVIVVKTKDGAIVHQSTLRLGPRETQRLVLQLKDETPEVYAQLEPDDLEFDNQVVLLLEKHKPVRVNLDIKDETLRPLLEKALQATRRVTLTGIKPDLQITDKADAEPSGSDTWLVEWVMDKDAESYVGPFVADRNHPLLEGLSLQGVVWGAGKTSEVSKTSEVWGRPILLAGNVPLITEAASSSGRRHLRIRLRPDLSTLQDTPQWPILIWNLVNRRAEHTTGLNRSNLRLRESALLTVPPGVEMIQLISPGAKPRSLPVQGRQVTIKPQSAGLHEVRAGETTFFLGANPLNRDESDLSACASGRWGEWADRTGQEMEPRHFAWILLLLAAAVLTVHMMLMRGVMS
jgi:hypothetical protein